jgi:hypothetical protein
MKTSALLLSRTLLGVMFFCLSNFAANAGSNPKKPVNWQTEFQKKISYGIKNKELLANTVVYLEVFIDEKGNVVIENYNASKPEAGEYVVKKLNGTQLNNEFNFNEKFVVKYQFR